MLLNRNGKQEKMNVQYGKGRACTVYSQMNERVTGEVMKNHVKK